MTVRLRLSRAAERRVRSGHCWVFESDIANVRDDGSAVAVAYDAKNRLLAIGLYDRGSRLRFRVLSREPCTVDGAELRGRVSGAAAKREEWFDAGTTGFRVVNGAGDRLPGVVIDRYGETAVLKLYSGAWKPWLQDLVDGCAQMAGVERVVLRLSRALAATGEIELVSGGVVSGTVLPAHSSFHENGVCFEVDPLRGQKTGFFLDQRENRARIESLVRESGARSVLNVFSYTGGFSLFAARGGASRVVSVDASRPAIDALQRNIHLNMGPGNDASMIAECEFENVCSDAFVAMRSMRESGRVFDVVIVDPPSMASRADQRDQALRAYGRLATLAARLVAPEGTLVLASCTARVRAEDFETVCVRGAERADRRLVVTARYGHAVDHPTAFDDAQYLKCLFASTATFS